MFIKKIEGRVVDFEFSLADWDKIKGEVTTSQKLEADIVTEIIELGIETYFKPKEETVT